MRFLRGDGPDIDLDQVSQNISDDDSSSSSDATSAAIEDRARFAAAQARCANILIFGRKGLPNDVFVRANDQSVIREPIIVDRSALQVAAPSTPATLTGLEIVPWKPVRDVLALQLWPAVIESRRMANASAKNVNAAPVIILGGPSDSNPSGFEFQMGDNRPSPPKTRGRKNRMAAPRNTLSPCLR